MQHKHLQPGIPQWNSLLTAPYSWANSKRLRGLQAAQAFTHSHESCWLLTKITKKGWKPKRISGSSPRSARPRGCVPLRPRRVWSAG